MACLTDLFFAWRRQIAEETLEVEFSASTGRGGKGKLVSVVAKDGADGQTAIDQIDGTNNT